MIADGLRKLFKTRRRTYQVPGQVHFEELTNVCLLAQALTYPIGHNQTVRIHKANGFNGSLLISKLSINT